MKGIARALWNYPSVFAGAVQVANAALAKADVLPAPVALGVSIAAAIVTFAAVSPANPK